MSTLCAYVHMHKHVHKQIKGKKDLFCSLFQRDQVMFIYPQTLGQSIIAAGTHGRGDPSPHGRQETEDEVGTRYCFQSPASSDLLPGAKLQYYQMQREHSAYVGDKPCSNHSTVIGEKYNQKWGDPDAERQSRGWTLAPGQTVQSLESEAFYRCNAKLLQWEKQADLPTGLQVPSQCLGQEHAEEKERHDAL